MERSNTLVRSLAIGLLAAATHVHAASPDEWVGRLQQAYVRAVTPGEQAERHRELLGIVWQRTLRSYASEIDADALGAAVLTALEPLPAGAGEPSAVFTKAMNEALRATLDPHSRYLDAKTMENDRGDGAFGGLGIEVDTDPQGVRVVAPMAGSPAARAGLREGDLIVRLDGQSLGGLPLPDAVSRMRGEPGTTVSLVVRRGPAEELPVALTREIIRRQPVQASMQGQVLVLKLGTFSAGVGLAMEKAIAEAAASTAPQGVVIDLRGNPGGLVREAVRVADAFLADGEIVSLRGRAAPTRSWKADAEQSLPGTPLVVLIDRRSASASEIVAAALQDHGRATVMGQRSFGNGTVQVTYPLGGQNGALKLTTSRYYSPAGVSVHGTGVTPKIELADTKRCAVTPGVRDEVLSCAIAFLHAGSVEAFGAATADMQP
jgi:C-terminal peptidase prc